MGEVYAASFAGGVDGIEKRCVIKMLHPDVARDPEYVARFLDEARVAVRLSQRNICQVFDVGIIEDQHFLAMELVHGRELRTTTKRLAAKHESIDEALAIHIATEVLDGLQYAHELKDAAGRPLAIVHRDVSPQNIMVSFDGDVKLIDFGLAASTIKVEHTERNVVMGKMAYLTPEQVRGERADATADVFACGVVLYELLTSARYYQGVAPMHLASVVASGAHEAAGFASLDPALAEILRRAVHGDRAQRCPSAAQLAGELRTWAQARGLRADAAQLRRFMRNLFGEPKEPWEAASAVVPRAATAPESEPGRGASPGVTASNTITQLVSGRGAAAADTRPTAAAAADAQFALPTRRESPSRPARTALFAAGLMTVFGAALAVGAWQVRKATADARPCERHLRVTPADGKAIAAGTTVRFPLERFATLPMSRQRDVAILEANGSPLHRIVDMTDEGQPSVVVALPSVPAEGLDLRASFCGDSATALRTDSVYLHEVDGTDAIHWRVKCGVPTNDTETCRLSRLPEGPRDALQAVLRATCRVDPYDGYDMTAEQDLSLPAGSYVVEGRWTTSTILYDYCDGQGARTSGTSALVLNDQEIARGPRPETGGTPGRECEADVEYQPSATLTATFRAQVELRGDDRLRFVVVAGDCALVTAQIHLGFRRVAVPEPIVHVED